MAIEQYLTLKNTQKNPNKIKQNKKKDCKSNQITTLHKANLVIHLIGEKHNALDKINRSSQNIGNLV